MSELSLGHPNAPEIAECVDYSALGLGRFDITIVTLNYWYTL